MVMHSYQNWKQVFLLFFQIKNAYMSCCFLWSFLLLYQYWKNIFLVRSSVQNGHWSLLRSFFGDKFRNLFCESRSKSTLVKRHWPCFGLELSTMSLYTLLDVFNVVLLILCFTAILTEMSANGMLAWWHFVTWRKL